MRRWDRIHASPAYRRLVRTKAVTISAMTAFFLAYYFALPVLVGYWPELMARRVFGTVNLAYAFAFSQFLMTWGIAYAYMRFAGRCDRETAAILADTAEEGPPAGAG